MDGFLAASAEIPQGLQWVGGVILLLNLGAFGYFFTYARQQIAATAERATSAEKALLAEKDNRHAEILALHEKYQERLQRALDGVAAVSDALRARSDGRG